MRAFSVPTLGGALVAAASLVYFTAANRWLGDEVLTQFVVAMAEVAVLQALVIPRTWLYVIGGTSERLALRISESVILEVSGGLLGFLLLILYFYLRALSTAACELRIALYLALWISSLTSATGYYRATHRWLGYLYWIAGPAMLRFPALLIWTNLKPVGLTTPTEAAAMMAIWTYFAPEVLKLLVGYLPMARTQWSTPSTRELRGALICVSANWRFDFLSSLTDSLDKVIVGRLFAPSVLVCYFFARRIAGLIPMVIEPYFTHVYQARVEKNSTSHDRSFWRRHYFRGLAGSLGIACSAGVAVVLLSLSIRTQALVPTAVAEALGLFCGVIALDAILCANKWYRYASQSRGASQLFWFRATGFIAFVGAVHLFHATQVGQTPLPAMLTTVAVDVLILIYIVRLATNSSPRPQT